MRGDRGVAIALVVVLAGGAMLFVSAALYLASVERETSAELARIVQESQEAERVQQRQAGPLLTASMQVAGFSPASATVRPLPELNELRDRIQKIRESVLPTDYSETGRNATLEEILTYLRFRLESAEGQLDRSQQEAKVASAGLKNAEKLKRDIESDRDKEIEDLTERIRELQQRVAETSERYSTRRRFLQEEERKLTERKALAERENDEELNRLETTLSRRRQDLDELVRKEAAVREEVVAVGQLLEPDPVTGYAYINLGSSHRITLGLRFRVYAAAKGSEKVWKGMVEVKDVLSDTVSKVSIARLYNPFVPMVEGDWIANPLYDPKRPRHVVLAGAFDPPQTPLAKEQAVARIQTIGSVVQEQVSYNTDYVILGHEFEGDPSVVEGTLLSVPFRSAREVFEFLED